MTRHDMTRHGRRQDKTRQDMERKENIDEDKTRRDKTRHGERKEQLFLIDLGSTSEALWSMKALEILEDTEDTAQPKFANKKYISKYNK